MYSLSGLELEEFRRTKPAPPFCVWLGTIIIGLTGRFCFPNLPIGLIYNEFKGGEHCQIQRASGAIANSEKSMRSRPVGYVGGC